MTQREPGWRTSSRLPTGGSFEGGTHTDTHTHTQKHRPLHNRQTALAVRTDPADFVGQASVKLALYTAGVCLSVCVSACVCIYRSLAALMYTHTAAASLGPS